VSDSELTVRLDTTLPASLPVGRGTAIFCLGACFHPRERLRGLEILVDGRPHRPAAWRMPRLDLYRLAGQPGPGWYRSGFWATVPIEPRERPGPVELSLAARLASGRRATAPLGRVEVVEPDAPPPSAGPPARAGAALIAVCMTTFEPDMELFRRQVGSLRAQTDTDWLCLISDDCSAPERFEQIRAEVEGDTRFVLSRSPRNLGYYRNFERALGLVPPEAELVALCDHDDRWHPEKLEVLRRELGGAQLVYSDQRLVDRDGRVLRGTLWEGRRNNHTDLVSLLVANTITGAATLFRREVAERALPFPDPPGWQFHDHWLGLVALASGDVAYVDRPLYDYVQHPAAVLGQAVGAGQRPAPTGLRGFLRGWRARYFYGYVARELLARALLVRCGPVLSARKRRALERFTSAPRSPIAFAWLAARPLRALAGATETLGTESELVRGIAWRHLISLRTGRRETPGRSPYEATCPPLDAAALGQERLARWRARV
jgi:glycosyltransferase involved in cell wall biosynthesis